MSSKKHEKSIPPEEKKTADPQQESVETGAEQLEVEDEVAQEKACGAGAEKPEERDGRDEEIIHLSEKLAEINDRYLRLMAEYDNYRKRTLKEKESLYPNAVGDTVAQFLPILDNFRRAIDTPCSDENFDRGVTMIYDSMMALLKSMGVEELGEPGEPFDPSIHNAVMHIEDESLGKNVVAQVLQKGYRMGDRVLRYAMVQQAN